MALLATRQNEQRGLSQKESVAAAVAQAFKEASDEQAALQCQWALNIGYYFGQQWNWSDIVKRENLRPAKPRAQLVYNLIQPAMQRAVARLTASNPWLTALPLSSDENDLQCARVATKLLRYWRTRVFDVDLLTEWAEWTAATGTGFAKVGWNPYATRSRLRRPLAPGAETVASAHGASRETGPANVSGFEAYAARLASSLEAAGANRAPEVTPEDLTSDEGDVLVEVVSPFEVFLEPRCRSWRRLNWMIHARLRSREDVKEEFGEKVSEQAASVVSSESSQVGFEVVRLWNNPSSALAQGAIPAPDVSEDELLIMEYFERPSRAYPYGRRCVVVGAETVKDEPNPFRFNDFPFAMTTYERLPGTIWGRGVPESLIPAQVEFNKCSSHLSDAINYGAHQKWWVRQGVTLTPREPANVPGEVVSTPDRSDIDLLPVAQLPAFLGTALQQQLSIIQDLGSSHETTQGTTPPNVRSGTAIQALQEADDRPLRPVYDSFNEAVRAAGEMLLVIGQTYYQTERVVQIIGLNGAPEVVRFAAADLVRVGHVITEPQSAYMESLAAKRELLTQFYQLAVFGPPGDRIASARFLRAMEMGNLTEVFEGDQTLDEALMERLQQMASQPGGVESLIQYLRQVAGPVAGPPMSGPQPQGAEQSPGMGPVATTGAPLGFAQ